MVFHATAADKNRGSRGSRRGGAHLRRWAAHLPRRDVRRRAWV